MVYDAEFILLCILYTPVYHPVYYGPMVRWYGCSVTVGIPDRLYVLLIWHGTWCAVRGTSGTVVWWYGTVVPYDGLVRRQGGHPSRSAHISHYELVYSTAVGGR